MGQLKNAIIESEKEMNDQNESKTEKFAKYEKEINRLKDDKFRLQEELNNAKSGHYGKYTMEIQKLKAEKINLEKQVRTLQTANSDTSEPSQASDNEELNKLKRDAEQNRVILRAK